MIGTQGSVDKVGARFKDTAAQWEGVQKTTKLSFKFVESTKNGFITEMRSQYVLLKISRFIFATPDLYSTYDTVGRTDGE